MIIEAFNKEAIIFVDTVLYESKENFKRKLLWKVIATNRANFIEFTCVQEDKIQAIKYVCLALIEYKTTHGI